MAFPTTLDTDFGTLIDNVDDAEAVNINELRRAIEGIEAKIGIDSSAVTASLDYKVNNFFVTGRKLYLYENVAPTGWTILAVTDKVLAVKGGSDAYNVSGGNTAGSFTITEAQMPAHAHGGVTGSGGIHSHTVPTCSTINWGVNIQADAANEDASTKDTSNSSAHTHTISSQGSGAGTYRPAACVGIIIQKT